MVGSVYERVVVGGWHRVGELARIEGGRGGRPLLLVHGFTSAKDDWVDHVEAFAASGWHAVAPDLPGHGESHPPGVEHTFDGYAGALLRLADELGWDRFALVGHSMGGIVAQHLAFAAEPRLTSLVLVGTSPDRIGVSEELVALAVEIVTTEGLPALLAAQKALGSPLETEAATRLRAERPGWEELQDAKFLRSSPEMYVAMARALTAAPSRVEQLGRLRVPTLVVVGEHDLLLRSAADDLVAAVPGAALAVIAGGGHSPQVEAPAAWFEAVSGFLQ
jgi:pimeloyl-ACP methyl ester carboxylesterase